LELVEIVKGLKDNDDEDMLFDVDGDGFRQARPPGPAADLQDERSMG
jgi:hypothetical protein